MIIKRHIEIDLKRLNELYNTSVHGADPRVPVYFSKLALLELSGWIECSFDLIASRAVKRRIKSVRFEKLVNQAIKKNHGLGYEDNFIDMMAKLVGLPACEILEKHLDSTGSLAVLKSELDAIIVQRRVAAHVALVHTTVGFDAPSVTLVRLKKVYPVVKDIYSWFC